MPLVLLKGTEVASVWTAHNLTTSPKTQLSRRLATRIFSWLVSFPPNSQQISTSVSSRQHSFNVSWCGIIRCCEFDFNFFVLQFQRRIHKKNYEIQFNIYVRL